MRTAERDQLAVIRFGAINNIIGANSAGIAQPGNVLWYCVWPGAGQYIYHVDPAIVVLSVEASADQSSGNAIRPTYASLAPGQFEIVTYDQGSPAALINAKHGWVCTAYDRRR